MAFGQSPGPPASSSQLKELLTLLQDAGYGDFRAARGPMGFTQRQGTGKFTRDEASALIDRLQEAEFETTSAAAPEAPAVLSLDELAMRRMPSEQLAAELQRRGWRVSEP